MAAVLLAVISPCLPMAGVASAQPMDRLSGGDRDPSIPEMELVFGFEGVFGVGRFAPLTVRLTGGFEPFSGMLTLRYRQGGAQSIASVAAVAATPGRTVEVPLLLALPVQFDALEVELHNHRGRRVLQREYRTGVGRSADSMLLPTGYGEGTSVFVIVGNSPAVLSLNSALQSWPSQTQVRRTTVNVTPNSLPLHDAAYEGVHLLIVDEQAGREIEPARVAAIRQWVASGGRIFVLTGRTGSAWRTFLPGPTVDAIRVGDLATHGKLGDLDGELDSLRQRLSAAAGGTPTWPTTAEEGDDAEPSPRDDPFRSASQVVGRLIGVSAAGEMMGWSARWTPTDAAGALSGRSGLLAEGPAGLGWAVVFGVEPRAVPEVANSSNELLIFRAAIGKVLSDFDGLQREHIANRWWSGPMPMSVESATTSSAQTEAFGVVLDGIESPTGAIMFVGIAMVLLALLVGPVDYFVLRRLRLSHRSWLTAFGWITLASAIAYVLPNMTDRGSTRLAQLHTLDAIAEPIDGAVLDHPPAIAWRTSLVGLYSSTRDLMSIVDRPGVSFGSAGVFGGAGAGDRRGGAASQEPAAMGGVWRGVAPTHAFWHERQPTGVRLPMLQSAPPPQASIGDDVWRGLAPGNAQQTGGQWLQPMSVGPWTLRTFEGHRREGGVLRASATVTERGESPRIVVRVVIDGLPPGAKVSNVWSGVGGSMFSKSFDSTVDADGRLTAVSMLNTWPGRSSRPMASTTNRLQSHWWPHSVTIDHNRMSEYLSGSERRTLALNHLAESGRWVVVHALLTRTEDGLLRIVGRNGRELPHEVVERLHLRVAVPLDDASAEVVGRLRAASVSPSDTPATGTAR